MPKISDKSIDMILCDLPYGMTECKWDEIIPFDLLWKEYNRIIKDRGAIVLTASQPFTTKLIMSNPSMFKYCWYWQKERGTNFQTAKYMPMKVIEECVVFGKGRINYYPIMTEIVPYKHVMPSKKENSSRHMHSSGLNDSGERIIKEYSTRHPENILKIPRDNMSYNKAFHPTQKPVALFEYFDRNASLMRALLSMKGDLSFQEQFKKVLWSNIFEKELSVHIKKDNLLVPSEYLITYILSAHLGVVQHWLEKDQRESPQQMASILYRLSFFGPIYAAGVNTRQPV